jgi:hypothetical protein
MDPRRIVPSGPTKFMSSRRNSCGPTGQPGRQVSPSSAAVTARTAGAGRGSTGLGGTVENVSAAKCAVAAVGPCGGAGAPHPRVQTVTAAAAAAAPNRRLAARCLITADPIT